MPAAAICTVFGFLFACIGGASYVYRGAHGLGASEIGLLFGATAVAVTGLPVRVLAVAFALALAGIGVTEPVLMGAAMNARSDGLGSARAVLGASRFVLGAVGTAAAGAAAAWTGLLLGIAVLAVLLTPALPRSRIPGREPSHEAA